MDAQDRWDGREDRDEAFLEQAWQDAGWHLHYLDVVQELAGFLRLEREEYRRSAFLDDRIRLRDPRAAPRALLPLESLLSFRPADPRRHGAHFIMHPGHCGSTLVSRLLDELGGVLGLREPAPLLALSTQWREQNDPLAHLSPQRYRELESVVLSLLARTFSPGERAVVKATSACCNLAERTLAFHPGTRIVWVYSGLEIYLAVMLRNRARREETRAVAQSRLLDLHRRMGDSSIRLPDLDLAQRAAMNWLASMAPAVRLQGDARVLLCDFDCFLGDPEGGLAAVARHLGLEPDPGALARAIRGGTMARYSKDPGASYDAGRRRQELEASRRENREAIRAGMSFAESLVRRFEALRPLERMLQ